METQPGSGELMGTPFPKPLPLLLSLRSGGKNSVRPLTVLPAGLSLAWLDQAAGMWLGGEAAWPPGMGLSS